MRTRRLPALLLALGVLVLAAQGGRPTFGGFVGTADSTVEASVDSLPQHVTISVPSGAGELDLHNPTSVPQELALRMLDPNDGSVVAAFESSGSDHTTLAPGASDKIALSPGASGRLSVGIPRPDGTLFPSQPYKVGAG
jgi:hypothetical protein